MSSFTPGPWETLEDDDGIVIVSKFRGAMARVSEAPEADADARLIAAATELLEVLQLLLYVERGVDVGLQERLYVLCRKAAVAIAKATGEGA